MNATALASSVNKLIDKFGNTIVYYPVKTGTYDSEGDWTPAYQTTTISSKWIETEHLSKLEFTEIGRFESKQGSMIMKNDVTITKRGKCVANGITWEITEIMPLRIKDVLILNQVTLRNIV